MPSGMAETTFTNFDVQIIIIILWGESRSRRHPYAYYGKNLIINLYCTLYKPTLQLYTDFPLWTPIRTLQNYKTIKRPQIIRDACYSTCFTVTYEVSLKKTKHGIDCDSTRTHLSLGGHETWNTPTENYTNRLERYHHEVRDRLSNTTWFYWHTHVIAKVGARIWSEGAGRDAWVELASKFKGQNGWQIDTTPRCC